MTSSEQLKHIDRELYVIRSCAAVLGWDQETYMPSRAIECRAEQLAWLEEQAHRLQTSAQTRELLEAAGKETGHDAEWHDWFRVFARNVRRAAALPAELVSEMARTVSLSQAAWAAARAAGDFSQFAPHLKKVLELVRSKARYYQAAALCPAAGSLYDCLLDEYEPGMTATKLTGLFDGMREPLSALVRRIVALPADSQLPAGPWPADAQAKLGSAILDALGFDRERGRLDVSAHPFTTTLGLDDVRITTRYDETWLPASLYGTIHEAGHAFYELGLAQGMNCLSAASSLGIHESQSRFWENIVGRSRSFLSFAGDQLRALFPAFAGWSNDKLYRAFNQVAFSPIRVEADEVSYNLHIILRFEIERDLVEGRLEVGDVCARWNERFASLFGFAPKNDREGALQDIHWSMGAFGYFPTYALGNLYAAQFAQALERDLPDVQEQIASGRFTAIREWLRTRIHVHGARLEPAEICRRVTGSGLDAGPFLSYLQKKYGELHGFA